MIEKIEINLLPAEYRLHQKSIVLLQREIVYPLLFIIVGCTWMAFWLVLINADINDYNNKIAQKEAEIKQNQYVQAEIRKLETNRATIQEKIRALERIDVNREKWVKLMEMFCNCLPDQTWLQSIAESDGVANLLDITGKTYSFPEVAGFMSRLTESEYVSGVDLVNIELIKGEARAFNFMLSCGINADAGLAAGKAQSAH
jgi:Tfp pilus assembly protein PilN